MFGVIFNSVAVVVGSLVGMIFKNFIPKRVTDGIMVGIGLCTMYIGIDGALCGDNTLVLVFSMALGAILGFLLDIDGKLNRLSEFACSKFNKNADSISVSQGLVTASLLFCVGSMTILGSLRAGIENDHTILVTKSVIDMFASVALSSVFGIGVMFSCFVVLVSQGGLVMLAQLIAPYLTTTVQNEMICTGSVIIIGLGLNLVGIAKIKVANYIPAMIIAPLITPLLNKLLEII